MIAFCFDFLSKFGIPHILQLLYSHIYFFFTHACAMALWIQMSLSLTRFCESLCLNYCIAMEEINRTLGSIALHSYLYINQLVFTFCCWSYSLTPIGQIDPFRVGDIFLPSRSLFKTLFTTKHFLEENNEIIVLSNSWIWY
jgi:hypothetical protein